MPNSTTQKIGTRATLAGPPVRRGPADHSRLAGWPPPGSPGAARRAFDVPGLVRPFGKSYSGALTFLHRFPMVEFI